MPFTCHRRRQLLILLGSTSALALAGCASALGDQTLFIDQARLQQRLDSRFPLNKAFLGLLNVTISQPRLRFDTSANRLGTTLNLTAPPMLGLTPALNGTLDLSYALRYEPADHSVRMRDVQVHSVNLKDSQGRSNSRVNSALSLVGQQLLQDFTLYKLTDADLAKAAQYQYVPVGISVKHNGLAVLLTPGK